MSTLLLPLTVRLYGPPAAGVCKCSIHLPFPSATPAADFPQLPLTRIFALGKSVPQSATCCCCCKTIPSLNKDGNFVCANKLPAIKMKVNSEIVLLHIPV